MDDVRGHEHDRTRPDRPVLRADGDRRPARDHVVDLVLRVGPLRIRPAGREFVQPDRQVVGPDELVVEAAGCAARGDQVGQFKRLHGALP
ncbi:MAG: hypothetical protein HW391_258 [Chloroflexi bacterium]|nr:hypothetical protein [Chloroflexota bacterium]